jgi:prevent-host-death family protein
MMRMSRNFRKIPIMKVTSAEFQKNYGTVADRALTEAVTITRNGRDRLVLLSAEEYSRLKRRDRRVVRVGELTLEEIAQIRASEMDPAHAHLDAELDGWRP